MMTLTGEWNVAGNNAPTSPGDVRLFTGFSGS